MVAWTFAHIEYMLAEGNKILHKNKIEDMMIHLCFQEGNFNFQTKT